MNKYSVKKKNSEGEIKELTYGIWGMQDHVVIVERNKRM